MKKTVSIILALGLFSGVADAAEMNIKSVIDPVEKIITINGSLSSGPDGKISVCVFDAAGNAVFADELLSGTDGAFKTSFDVGDMPDGEYLVQFKSSDSEGCKMNFTPPRLDSAVKLKIAAQNNILLIKDNMPDPDCCEIAAEVQNAELVRGTLNSADFTAEGLPEGYTIEAKATEANKIIFTLKGSGAVDKNYNIRLRLNSTVIANGAANTASDAIDAVIYPQQVGQKVNVDKYEFTAYMKDSKNIDADRSVSEAAIIMRNLAKEGLLTAGEDYELSIPSELSGLKCELAANKAENKIQMKFSGKLDNALSKDTSFNLVLKSSCVDGAEKDSDPITVTLKKAASSGSSGGGSGTGGTSSGGGYTGGGKTTVDITPTVPEKNVSFEDISGHWAEDEILKLAKDGYISGVGNNLFVPNRSISRAEFITLAVKAFNITSGKYNNDFADVASDAWYAGNIGKALSAGIISKDTNFRPNDPIKREEMVKVIIGGWLMSNEKPEWINMAQFADKADISAWALDYVDYAVTLGLIKGDNSNNFNPKKSTTRAEAATIFYRLLYLN